MLTAVKVADNPLAAGRPAAEPTAISLRLVEAVGASTSCTITPSFAAGDLQPADLLERAVDGAAPVHGRVPLTPMQIRTLRLPVDAASAAGVDLAADTEPHQPAYARYWLNNTGPAPRGNLPMTVHCEPSVVEAGDGVDGPVEITVRVASDSSVETAASLRVVVPDGWQAQPADFDVAVPPGGFAERQVQVTAPGQVPDGSWWVRVQAGADGHLVEDVTRVLVGTVTDAELAVTVTGPGPLGPGSEGAIEIALTSTARSELVAQVQLVSPWHTWELVPSWDTGATVAAGSTETVRLPVRVPPGTAPGRWWVLAKVAAAGGLYYSEPVELVVTAP